MAVSLWGRLMAGVQAAAIAFREGYTSGDPAGSDFGSYDARRLRYAMNWAYYQGTPYRDLNAWAPKLRADLGLYRFIRAIHSPAYRLAEMHVTHLQGGFLDADAQEAGALPIVTTSNDLRRAIAALWKASNWGSQKSTYTRWGTVLGDVALEVIDDVTRKRVYLDVVHPSLLASVDTDRFGNVKGYVRIEQRPNPDKSSETVEYKEVVERDKQNVVYRTYRDDKAYAWPGREQMWAIPYGFVPLVLVPHLDVGLGWGWSELHAGLTKVREADDAASLLNDQIRKLVNAPWLFSGLNKPAETPQTRETGREDIPAFYGPSGATATALVAPLDIAATSARIQDVIADLERDYPELRFDRLRAQGDASGEALRIARQPAEAKFLGRRVGYDDGSRRIHQMAVAIGGWRNYDGYSGFDLGSYDNNQLDHSIGERPVFGTDEAERLAQDTTFWAAAESAGRAGLPLTTYLRDAGWDEKRIQKLLTDKELQANSAAAAFDRALNSGAV